MTGRNLLGLSFRVIGLVFAGLALVVAVSTATFVVRADTVTGRVVDYEVEQHAVTFLQDDEGAGRVYFPVVEYAVAGGETLTVTGRTGQTSQPYEIGASVSVLVSSSNPDNARLNTVMGVWGSAIVLGALGALFVLLSVLAPQGFGGSRRSA